MNIIKLRQQFAKILEQHFVAYKNKRWDEVDFIVQLGEANPLFINPKSTGDVSLQAAWNFSDSFFDAVYHDFTEYVILVDQNDKKISKEQCEILIQYIIERFKLGKDIEDPAILSYSRL